MKLFARSRHLIPWIACALATLLAGLGLIYARLGEGLSRFSFDSLFLMSNEGSDPEIVLVYLDDKSAHELDQPLDAAWDRRFHVHLLERLTKEGARLVFYDIIFANAAQADTDEAFAAAIASNGRVILGAEFETYQTEHDPRQPVTDKRIIIAPYAPFRRAAAGWGMLELRPIDPDYGVRKICSGTAEFPSAVWLAHRALGLTPLDHDDSNRWIRFPGLFGDFLSVNLAEAITPGLLPEGYFKNKIVMIGGRPSGAGPIGLGKDEFATPHSRWFTDRYVPGLEIHAATLQSLLRGSWLWRIPLWSELLLVAVLAFGMTWIYSYSRLVAALFALVIVQVAILVGAITLFTMNAWFSWAGLSLENGLGFFACMVVRYQIETIKRRRLRNAFACYLSPTMANRIADSNVDLRPGGKLEVVTVMFTDLEGFSKMSEKVRSPERISDLLIEYFTKTTESILATDGCIIKYIGDAVMAAWGVPGEQENHAALALEAAEALFSTGNLEIDGMVLRTRVGVHTGEVLAGNLGSPFRFDYTVIGDTVNTASRLEGANKLLGTTVLVSLETAIAAEALDRCRRLGIFQFYGKDETLEIAEFLPKRERGALWIELFHQGLDAFTDGRVEEAVRAFEKVITTREGGDSASQFMLDRLRAYKEKEIWNRIVVLDMK